MILLFEDHTYSQDISQYVSDMARIGLHRRKNGNSLSLVGYYYNKTVNDVVLIMPKVFIYNEFQESEGDDDSNQRGIYKAFGRFMPEDLLDSAIFEKHHKDDDDFKNQKELIFELSTWVYQAIGRYKKRNPQSKAIIPSVGYSIATETGALHENTLLDLIMSLKKFAENNQAFFIYVIQNSRSGYHKINWKKTIKKQHPIFSDNIPIYFDPITKQKKINYDEELLVILFSALANIREKYGINSPINENYSLMSKKEYSSFSLRAKKRLEEIKRHYFSDKSLELWNLLYLYFCKCDSIRSNKIQEDQLLVNNFHVVFEDMIDYLLSDNVKIPKELKEQADGKRVDHIYRDASLVYDDDIFYVGDSKYYKEGRDLEEKSIAKQYTYAKNIIQRNIDVLRFGAKKSDRLSDEDYIQYRDDLTEGYNITPNFFISGVIDDKLDYNSENLTSLDKENNAAYISKQFPNRLFDRDTLILQRYNINFLYVLSRYARNKNVDQFKTVARAKFKNDLSQRLDGKYSFFQLTELTDNQTISSFLDKHFRTVYGKVFSFPVSNMDSNICLLMALENGVICNNITVDKQTGIICIDCNQYQFRQIYLNPADEIPNGIETSQIKETEDSGSVEDKPLFQWFVEGDINEELKFSMYLPLYENKCACGVLSGNRYYLSAPVGWVYAANAGIRLQKNMIVVRAEGDSMEPKIYDGDYCVFQQYGGDQGIAGSRQGAIVLAAEYEYGSAPDSPVRCLIKKYVSPKLYDSKNGWTTSKEVRLKSLNNKYKDIVYDGTDESVSLQTPGIFVCVIRQD